jgi:hypothetical protein
MTDPNTHELMPKDTIFELLNELKEAPSADDFDKGYRQGMARALDVFKQQSEVFGIGASVGLQKFEYLEWIG